MYIKIMYIKSTKNYIRNYKTGKSVENLFYQYCSKNPNIICTSTGENSYENVKQGIDFFVKIRLDGVIYNFGVDVKAKYNNNTANTVSIAYKNRLGRPGTLETSKCEYYAFNKPYKGVDRFYLIDANILKDHCLNHLKPFDGEDNGQYFILDMDWVCTHWSFFITENGYVKKSQYGKYNKI